MLQAICLITIFYIGQWHDTCCKSKGSRQCGVSLSFASIRAPKQNSSLLDSHNLVLMKSSSSAWMLFASAVSYKYSGRKYFHNLCHTIPLSGWVSAALNHHSPLKVSTQLLSLIIFFSIPIGKSLQMGEDFLPQVCEEIVDNPIGTIHPLLYHKRRKWI